jgi:hypothetical protein
MEFGKIARTHQTTGIFRSALQEARDSNRAQHQRCVACVFQSSTPSFQRRPAHEMIAQICCTKILKLWDVSVRRNNSRSQPLLNRRVFSI